jgi:hypothetical protein
MDRYQEITNNLHYALTSIQDAESFRAKLANELDALKESLGEAFLNTESNALVRFIKSCEPLMRNLENTIENAAEAATVAWSEFDDNSVGVYGAGYSDGYTGSQSDPSRDYVGWEIENYQQGYTSGQYQRLLLRGVEL